MLPRVESPEQGLKLALIGAHFSLSLSLSHSLSLSLSLSHILASDCIKHTRVNREILSEYLLHLLNEMDPAVYMSFLGLTEPTTDIRFILHRIADQFFPVSKREKNPASLNGEVVTDSQSQSIEPSVDQDFQPINTQVSVWDTRDIDPLRMQKAMEHFLFSFRSGKMGRMTVDDISKAGPL
jgi:hypothetical protein